MSDPKEPPKKISITEETPDKDDDWESVNQPAKAEEADYEEAARSTADYANYEPPKKQRSPIWKRLFVGLIVIIILAGIGGGAYWYLKNHKSTPKPAATTQTTQSTKPSSAAVATTTKHYASSNFYLGFDYPQDWTVVDNGGGVMTVTSPSMQLKDASGQNVSGKIVMTIRSKDQKLPEFDSGNAIAAIASEKINYTKPTQNQRGSTYISYLRYASTTSTSGLDALYVTGDNGYTVGQDIPKTDIAKVDPIISIGFTKCGNTTCSGSGSALTIAASSWSDKTLSGPVEAIIKSLSIT